jgi:hypothetical protein
MIFQHIQILDKHAMVDKYFDRNWLLVTSYISGFSFDVIMLWEIHSHTQQKIHDSIYLFVIKFIIRQCMRRPVNMWLIITRQCMRRPVNTWLKILEWVYTTCMTDFWNFFQCASNWRLQCDSHCIEIVIINYFQLFQNLHLWRSFPLHLHLDITCRLLALHLQTF